MLNREKPKWGSGGRRFKSSHPDQLKQVFRRPQAAFSFAGVPENVTSRAAGRPVAAGQLYVSGIFYSRRDRG
jgi:hypothetical protein